VATRNKRNRGAGAHAEPPPARNDGGSERFSELIGEVERRSAAAPSVRPQRRRARVLRDSADAPLVFEIERSGERYCGLTPGGDRRGLRRLQQGEVRPERRLDLHGQNAATARRAVRSAISEAIAAGERCLLVVHGRGLRSGGDALLRESLPAWLAEAPHAREVLAFASAVARDGGAGACYVLLRRKR
jgi:DNA-nicking Smr family endonuclease